jgi:NifB/MoaA-like Fe-S oxidoreductase
MTHKQLVVSALENGTVLDHIPAENVYKALDILNLKGIDQQITIGINLTSKFFGKKGIIKIENKFFGPEITVSGLLTGKDVAEQLQDVSLGDEVLIPAAMLRAEGDLFLCGMTPDALSDKLQVPIRAVRNDGAELLAAMLGVKCPY